MTIADELPAQQAVLYAALFLKGDVAIETLHEALFSKSEKTRVEQQQALGPYITRMNRRLQRHAMVVKPGTIKGTYTLARI